MADKHWQGICGMATNWLVPKPDKPRHDQWGTRAALEYEHRYVSAGLDSDVLKRARELAESLRANGCYHTNNATVILMAAKELGFELPPYTGTVPVHI